MRDAGGELGKLDTKALRVKPIFKEYEWGDKAENIKKTDPTGKRAKMNLYTRMIGKFIILTNLIIIACMSMNLSNIISHNNVVISKSRANSCSKTVVKVLFMQLLLLEFDRSQESLTTVMLMHNVLDILVSLLVEVECIVKQIPLPLLSK